MHQALLSCLLLIPLSGCAGSPRLGPERPTPLDGLWRVNCISNSPVGNEFRDLFDQYQMLHEAIEPPRGHRKASKLRIQQDGHRVATLVWLREDDSEIGQVAVTLYPDGRGYRLSELPERSKATSRGSVRRQQTRLSIDRTGKLVGVVHIRSLSTAGSNEWTSRFSCHPAN